MAPRRLKTLAACMDHSAIMTLGLILLGYPSVSSAESTSVATLQITPDYLDSQACSGFLTIVGNYTTSPHFPQKYPARMDCRRILTAPAGYNINIDFTYFAIEPSKGCKYDFLEVRDGPFGYSPKQKSGRFCGKMSGVTLRSSGRHLWIRMKTDDLVEDVGFSVTITMVKDDSGIGLSFDSAAGAEADTVMDSSYVASHASVDCYNVVIADEEGTISTRSSPNLERWFVNNTVGPVDCAWDIRTDNTSAIYLVFSEFKVSSSALSWMCASGTVEVYDGGTSDSDIMRKECFSPPAALVTRSTRALVRIRTEPATTSLTFSMTYTKLYAEDDCHDKFKCDDGHCVSRQLQCNGRMNCKDNSDENCQADQDQDVAEDILSWKYGLILGISAGATLLLITGVLVHNAWLKHKGRGSGPLSLRASLKAAGARRAAALAIARKGRRHYQRANLSYEFRGGGGISSTSELAWLCRADGVQMQCSRCDAELRRAPPVARSQTTESCVTEQTLLSASPSLLQQQQPLLGGGGCGESTHFFMSPKASIDEEPSSGDEDDSEVRYGEAVAPRAAIKASPAAAAGRGYAGPLRSLSASSNGGSGVGAAAAGPTGRCPLATADDMDFADDAAAAHVTLNGLESQAPQPQSTAAGPDAATTKAVGAAAQRPASNAPVAAASGAGTAERALPANVESRGGSGGAARARVRQHRPLTRDPRVYDLSPTESEEAAR